MRTVGSHAVTTPASGVSDVNNGAVIFTVTDATIENVTFTATDTTDNITLNQTATVNFIGPPPAAAGIGANPTTATANGSSPSTVTVTLLDANSNGIPGKTITISQGNGHSAIGSPNPAVTDSNGQIMFTVTDVVAEAVTYTAVDTTDGLPIPGSATVTFTGGSPPACNLSLPTAAPGFAYTSFVTGFPFATAPG